MQKKLRFHFEFIIAANPLSDEYHLWHVDIAHITRYIFSWIFPFSNNVNKSGRDAVFMYLLQNY
jgi:hypothetical protein